MKFETCVDNRFAEIIAAQGRKIDSLLVQLYHEDFPADEPTREPLDGHV